MDIRAQQAREHHEMAGSLDAQAARHRSMRDNLIRRLRDEDPKRWSYGKLAKEIGCSKELVAYICQHPERAGAARDADPR